MVNVATPPDQEQLEKSSPKKDDKTCTQQPSAGYRKDGTIPQRTARQQECASSSVNNNNDDNSTTSPVKNDKSEFICYNCGCAGQCIMRNCPHKTKENGEPTVLAKRQSTTAESFLIANKVEDVLDDAYYECAYDFTNVGTTNTTTLDLRGKDHVFNNCNDKQRLPDLWMLLDNQSTVHIFRNTMFLVNVRQTKKKLRLQTNTGDAIIDEIGDLPGFGTVWVHHNGIANILSLEWVATMPKYFIDYSNRTQTRDFRVESPDGKVLSFIPNGRGLHYLDCTEYFGPGKNGGVFGKTIYNTESQLSIDNNQSAHVIDSLDDNKTKFAKRNVEQATTARRFKEIAVFLSNKTLTHCITNNVIKNNPITLRDVSIMNKMLGKNIHALQGKTTIKKNTIVERDLDPIPIPPTIEQYYSSLTIAADVLFVNGIPVLATVCQGIKYGTVKPIASTKIPDLQSVIAGVIQSYKIREFTVVCLLVDIQFKALEDCFKNVTVNVVSRAEHVTDIE